MLNLVICIFRPNKSLLKVPLQALTYLIQLDENIPFISAKAEPFASISMYTVGYAN